MKILVTGANGQLGSSIKKIAANYPQHAFTFTDLPQADITARDSIDSLIEQYEPEAIINCAAYTAVDRAESEPDIAARVNTLGAEVLAGAARENDIALIHISTDYVFEGSAPHPLNENSPTCPLNMYGKTKLEGEQAIRDSRCRGAIIRTSWLYSEYGSNFVKTMLRLAGEKKSLSVVYDQTGSPTYAPDLAAAIMKVLEAGVTGMTTYHYGNSGVASWYDMACEIFRIAGKPVKVVPVTAASYGSPTLRPYYTVLNCDLIREITGDIPYWRDSLEKCLNNLKQEK